MNLQLRQPNLQLQQLITQLENALLKGGEVTGAAAGPVMCCGVYAPLAFAHSSIDRMSIMLLPVQLCGGTWTVRTCY